MMEFTWVTISQPLYVARTGMERSLLGRRVTEDEWQDTLEAAESALIHFCTPERVYALGVTDRQAEHAGNYDGSFGQSPAYLVASGIYLDTGQRDHEVLITGDDTETTAAEARKWVQGWVDRGQKGLTELGEHAGEPNP